jgi:hypothetical protein
MKAQRMLALIGKEGSMNVNSSSISAFAAAVQRLTPAIRPRSLYDALLCLLTVVTGTGYAQSGSSEQNLTGAWNVTIDFGGVIPTCSAPAVNNRDGGIVSNACTANESPGYGQWVRTGNGEFALTFVGLEYGVDENTGAVLGTSTIGKYKVRANINLGNDGQEFSGPFKTEIFDLDGNLQFTVDGTVTGKRIVVEPF